MCYLKNLCFLCLTYEQNISQVDNYFKMQEELQCFIPQHILGESKIPKHICDKCLERLNNVSEFRKACLRNIAIFNKYVQKLTLELGANKDLSVGCTDILNYKTSQIFPEINYKKYSNEEENYNTFIKKEILDESATDHRIEDSKNAEKVEQVLIKSEDTTDDYFSGNEEMVIDVEPHFIESDEQQEQSCSKNSSHINETTGNAVAPLLPEKSRTKYEKVFERYVKWCNEEKINNYENEKVLLAYFEYLSHCYKSSSLWTFYSMLRTVISMKKNVDISKYVHLVSFLKGKSEGYTPKKSKVLYKPEITRFLQQADDRNYLLMKVALIIGISGACRTEELTNLLLENVKDEGKVFHILIPSTKSKVAREFFISSRDITGLNMVEIIRKYVALRPHDTTHGRFFVGYRNGKCNKQPVGVNTLSTIPKTIASFLQLPNSEEYTGHCFRRSSSSLLAD